MVSLNEEKEKEGRGKEQIRKSQRPVCDHIIGPNQPVPSLTREKGYVKRIGMRWTNARDFRSYPIFLEMDIKIRVLAVNSIFKIKNPNFIISFKNMIKLVCCRVGDYF